MSDIEPTGQVSTSMSADEDSQGTSGSTSQSRRRRRRHYDPEAFHRKMVVDYFESHTDPLYLPPERRQAKKDGRRRSEWEEFGDPRVFVGHFRPKLNLGKFLQANPSWSQRRLAEEMGTDVGTVSNWISGRRYMSDRKLVQAAHVTGLSIPYLLDLRHVYFNIDVLVQDYEFVKGKEDDHLELGKAYAPHEVTGFADDLYSLRYQLEELVNEDNRESVFAEALATQAEEWYNEDGEFIEDMYEKHDGMQAWKTWYLYGDARDPRHLHEELHAYVLALPDEYNEDGFFLAPHKIKTEALDCLADVLQSSANMDRA